MDWFPTLRKGGVDFADEDRGQTSERKEVLASVGGGGLTTSKVRESPVTLPPARDEDEIGGTVQ
jgi:hypothetical protein